jgi:hypothetical protein
MMQDRADRLDLFEQNRAEQASRPLIVHPERGREASALAAV